ncbi:MAG TPA: hypothetical protein VHL58_04280, partial [Thermoanaerobaculia bacterium]|nr:hypothetical protein [Thermoanaerobaculia bacterium]
MVKRLPLLFLCIVAALSAHAQRRRGVSPPLGCSSAILAEAAVSEVASVDGMLYYSDWGTRGVWSVPKSGGSPK